MARPNYARRQFRLPSFLSLAPVPSANLQPSAPLPQSETAEQAPQTFASPTPPSTTDTNDYQDSPKTHE